jgi:hypothetical protein
MHGGGERCLWFLLGGLKGRDHWEDLDVSGANWIHLAQDRVWWQAYVNTTESSGSIKKAGYSLTSLVTISFSISCTIE